MRLNISPRLLSELEELSPTQRAAVLHPGNAVVSAGPGSGKTRTLVARAGYLLDTQVSNFRGVACITYTNAAANEVRIRTRKLGISTGRRLACSTLHSFCLNHILRAYSAITLEWVPSHGQVLGDEDVIGLLEACFDRIGITDTAARWRVPQITKIRRSIACGEDMQSFDEREVRAAEMYDQSLKERNEIDFEAMVVRALRIVRSNGAVRDLLRARFPHLIVDEYQDLGGVLHQLVLALHEWAGVTVFAVGDADQSVFGFTGADPRYLEELRHRHDFHHFELELNYRSGRDIIRASEAALGHSRGRRATDDADEGVVDLIQSQGSLDDHARESGRLVEDAISQGVPPERIAVLYPARGQVLNALLSDFKQRDFPYLYERDETLPKGSVAKLVQRCASRALVMGEAHRAPTAIAGRDILDRTEAPTLLNLEGELLGIRREAGLPEVSTRLAILRRMQRLIDPSNPVRAEDPAGPWVRTIVEELELVDLARAHADRDNRESVNELLELVEARRFQMQDIASGVEVIGKVVLTTYHSSKGREFHTVILPGLVNGIIPRDVNDRGRWRSANSKELDEQRRSFYVAITRAEATVHLITGRGFTAANGRWLPRGPSDFLVEMMGRLRSG